ncbi:DUF305 domain-containing protein [Knoellia aerolata]|uniref:DUF305 domain-containing protein n=1 Tax=Knoellia aerolata DSM 18566 TaxID=1385519 RepID=A0A0A0JJ23_9MICO|nr:DUF305 domain-containing protein [Knoellia aerolata]KGN37078.1 hypothetical protein N801_01045 [Knoellia aerolata DSM 18566]
MPIRLRALATLSLVVMLGLTGCSGDEPQPVPGTPGPTSTDPVIQPGLPGEPNATLSGSAAATAGPRPTVAAGDVTFFQDMIVHHAQAIVMVETAMPRLTDTQVKAIASRIADEQDPEIKYMARWLTDRKQEVPPQATNPRLGDHSHDGMPGMATAAQLADLAKASGVAADRLFLTLMTAHHEGALAMVGDHGDVAGEETVSEVAAEINVTQLKQIQQMQTMLQRLA